MLGLKYLFGLASKNETMLFPIWTTRQRINLTNTYTHIFTEDCFVILSITRSNASVTSIDGNTIAEYYGDDAPAYLSFYVRQGSVLQYHIVTIPTADWIDIYQIG